MRKIACIVSAAALAFTLPCFTACSDENARSHYSIRGEYLPEESAFVATMSAEIVNKTDTALKSLSFELYANAYREGALHPPVSELYEPVAYYAGKSYGSVEIGEVKGAESFSVGGEDENILYVTLGEELYPDECVSLEIGYRIELAAIDHRLGVGEHAVNLSGFYPVLCAYDGGFLECVYSENGDPFVSDCADYDVEIVLPAPYEVIGASLQSGGEKRVWSHHAENVRDVAFVIAEGFDSVSREVNGVPVTYYYFSDDDPGLTLSAAADSLACFSELFSPYAYPSYTVVQTDFPYGGMEYPAFTMVNCLLRDEEKPFVVAHETAHQWWYAMVGSNQFEEAWQDEGLAEYSVALFADRYPGYGKTYRELINESESAYRAFYSVYSQVSGETDTSMSRPLTSYAGLYEYRNLAYDKGVILFDRLRDVAGEKKLIKGLSCYAEKFSGAIAKPADLVACFAEAGANVGELLFSFTEGRCVI